MNNLLDIKRELEESNDVATELRGSVMGILHSILKWAGIIFLGLGCVLIVIVLWEFFVILAIFAAFFAMMMPAVDQIEKWMDEFE